MKQINNKWVDKNNNSWDCDVYTQEQAKKLSKTLINCSDCLNCSYCSRCFRCSNCFDCSDCFGCSNCSRCSGCSGCSRCFGCSDCSGCSGCSDFKTNPRRYIGRRIGSRNSQTTTYWTDEKIQVVCGCFVGTLKEFEKKVKETHGDNEYGKQYQQYIQIVKTIIDTEAEDSQSIAITKETCVCIEKEV